MNLCQDMQKTIKRAVEVHLLPPYSLSDHCVIPFVTECYVQHLGF